MLSGNTNEDGIQILSPSNNGKLLLQNDNSTSDQYIPKISGEASDGMTAAGLPGLIVEGRPSQDNADNPCIVLRGIDATSDSATEASGILQIRNYTTDLINIDFLGKTSIGSTDTYGMLSVTTGSVDENTYGNIFISNGTQSTRLGQTANYGWLQSHSSKPLYINPLGNNVIFSRDAGDIGIGTTNPAGKLDVRVGSTGNDLNIVFKEDSSDNSSIIFRESSTDYFSIQYNGGAGTSPNNLLKIRSADGGDGTIDVDAVQIKQSGHVSVGQTGSGYFNVIGDNNPTAYFKNTAAAGPTIIRLDANSGTATDTGVGSMQDYWDPLYCAEDYVGTGWTFT